MMKFLKKMSGLELEIESNFVQRRLLITAQSNEKLTLIFELLNKITH